jgi:hypothetical protein
METRQRAAKGFGHERRARGQNPKKSIGIYGYLGSAAASVQRAFPLQTAALIKDRGGD